MINIGISEENRKEITQHLNNLLSNEYILYTKTLKYHWNIKGKFFGPLHELFRKNYEELFIIIDDIAERVRSLDYDALGTLEEFKKYTTLHEEPQKNPDDLGMIEKLLKDHEEIIKQIRNDIDITMELNDAGTNNFLQEILMKHEKTAWMLRSHLE